MKRLAAAKAAAEWEGDNMSEFTIQGWGKTVTLEFPDEMSDQGPNAFALRYDYEPVLLDEDDNEYDNPEDKAAFALKRIITFVKEVIRSASVEVASTQAANTASVLLDQQMDSITVEIEDSP